MVRIKKHENQVRFVQTDGAVYCYKDDATEPGQNNLFRLAIEDGVLREKKAITNYVMDIKMGYKGGVFYFRQSLDVPNRSKILYYTDGTDTLSFESLPEETGPFTVNGNAYLLAPREEGERQDIYSFDGHGTTLVAEGCGILSTRTINSTTPRTKVPPFPCIREYVGGGGECRRCHRLSMRTSYDLRRRNRRQLIY